MIALLAATLAATPWWVASLVANGSIAWIEYMNRAGGYANFRETLWHTGPIILLAQWGLYRAWSGAPSFMFAWAFFSAINLVLRLASNHFLVAEPLSIRGWAGVTFMFVGAYMVKTGSAG